jgi:hypothetical protein
MTPVLEPFTLHTLKSKKLLFLALDTVASKVATAGKV